MDEMLPESQRSSVAEYMVRTNWKTSREHVRKNKSCAKL